ncbi:MAG: hypothetical protein QXL00_05125 [Conexivisphaerales archaeon]
MSICKAVDYFIHQMYALLMAEASILQASGLQDKSQRVLTQRAGSPLDLDESEQKYL